MEFIAAQRIVLAQSGTSDLSVWGTGGPDSSCAPIGAHGQCSNFWLLFTCTGCWHQPFKPVLHPFLPKMHHYMTSDFWHRKADRNSSKIAWKTKNSSLNTEDLPPSPYIFSYLAKDWYKQQNLSHISSHRPAPRHLNFQEQNPLFTPWITTIKCDSCIFLQDAIL